MNDFDQVHGLYFGGCPECGTEGLYTNIGRDHWFYCQGRKVKWLGGSNLFSSWYDETVEDWQRNADMLADFTETFPIYDKREARLSSE